jgi:predicted DNA-binding protein
MQTITIDLSDGLLSVLRELSAQSGEPMERLAARALSWGLEEMEDSAAAEAALEEHIRAGGRGVPLESVAEECGVHVAG